MGEVSNYCCFVIVDARHVSYCKSRDVRRTPVRRSGYSQPQRDHYDNHWLHHSTVSSAPLISPALALLQVRSVYVACLLVVWHFL